MNLRKQLKKGEVIFGLCSMYPASGIIECMCPGWDFVWIDGQHGQHSYDSLYHCAQAARAVGVPSVIRAASHDYESLSRIADLAPSAIMIPMVNSAKEAETVVKSLKFPPKGIRSYGGRTTVDLYGREYHKIIEPLIFVQIETESALENANDIASVDGVDVLFFGPDDMKLSKNIDINVKVLENQLLKDGLKKVSNAAKNNNKHCAAIAQSETELKFYTGIGYQIIVAGGDSIFIRNESSRKLMEMRDAIRKK